MVFLLVMYGYERWTIKKQNVEELMPLNCGIEDLESLVWQGDQTSQC